MILIKLVHVSCALLSITGFLARSYLIFTQSRYLQQRWLKITPHLIDTLLLASGVTLVLYTRQYPFVMSWITVKLFIVVLYIAFGLYTFRFAKTRIQFTGGFIGACLSFSFIIAIAITHQAWPF